MLGKFTTLFARFSKIFTGEISISGMHFILSVVLLRHLSLEDYGLFSLIFLFGGIFYAYLSAIAATPLSIYIPRVKSLRAIYRYEVIFGSIGLLTIVASFFICFFFFLFFNMQVLTAALSALSLSLWGARALIRGLFFARSLTRFALYGDFIYAFVGLNIMCFLLLMPQYFNLDVALLIVIVPQILSVICSLIIKGDKIRISLGKHVWHNYKKLSLKNAFWDSLTTSISFVQSHSQSFAVASMFGAGAYAPLAAGLVIFGPFRTVTMALGNTLRPDFSRSIAQKDVFSLNSSLKFGILGMTAMSCAFLVFIWLFWSYIYGFLFETKFHDLSIGLIVLLNGIAALIYTNANVLQFFLQAKQMNQSIAYSRMVGAIVAVISVMPLLHFLPIAFSVIALILAEAASLIYLSIVVYREMKRLETNMPINMANTK